MMQTQENTPPAEQMPGREDFKKIIETLLFITDRPLSIARLSQAAEVNDAALTLDIVEELRSSYAAASAVHIIEIGGGFQMSTKPEYGRWVRKLFNEKMSAKLSPAALETLAIIAYKQPVTRAEIEAIRGVDIVAPLERLMERGLTRVIGKKDTPGKPMVYGTTEEFLRIFGLNKLSELPDIAAFSDKGLREVQSDLPFGEALPDIKENIIPLTDEESLEYNYSYTRAEDAPAQVPAAPAQEPVPSEEAPAEQPAHSEELPQSEATAPVRQSVPDGPTAQTGDPELLKDSMEQVEELKGNN